MSYDEDRYERIIESEMNRLDAQLLKGVLSQEEYDQEVADLDKWAKEEYRRINNRLDHLLKW